jgi:aminoglycoside phosphotransferase (APT) family kinase protein
MSTDPQQKKTDQAHPLSPSFDTEKLTTHLESKINGFKGPLTAKKFAGGQSNPTYLLQAQSGSYVLRRQPAGTLLKSAHAVDREFRVLKALAHTDVPVAQAYFLCEDPEVIGSMFYVMSYEDGQIFWNPAFPELPKENRSAYMDELIRILANLHNVNVEEVGLSDYGRPGNYYERQIGMWTKQYRASETSHLPAMERLIEWLPAHCPPDDGQVSLVHGDYRLDNVMFKQNQAQGQAVLDWELSTLGHPLADLAYFCMCLRLPAGGHIPGLAGKDLQELGLPDEPSIIKRYCELRGIESISNWHFYLAFSFFRLAAIAQGVLKRALDGNAASDKAMVVGRMTAPLAEMALHIIDTDH